MMTKLFIFHSQTTYIIKTLSLYHNFQLNNCAGLYFYTSIHTISLYKYILEQ
jgi:hypothetical protein